MTRQIYNYSAGFDVSALMSALSSNVAVHGITRSDKTSQIFVDFHPDATSTELSSAQTTITSAPYSLTHSSDDSTISSTPWVPTDLPGLEIYIDGSHTGHAWTTTAGEVPIAADSDPIGLMFEPSTSCHAIEQPTTTRRPALASDGAPESHIRFDPTQNSNTVQFLRVRNSVSAFNFIHQTAIFCVLIKLRTEVDATTKNVLDSNTVGTGGQGFSIQITSGNRVLVNVRGANGNVWNATTSSSHTILNANGLVTLRVSSSDGSTLTVEKLNSSGVSQWSETFSRTNAPGGTANALNDLVIGTTLASAVNGLNASVQAIAISTQALATDEIARFATYSPRRSSISQLRVDGRTLTNFCYRFYDFTDLTRLWTDTARTTNVATNGDTIAAIDHFGDTSTHLARGSSQSTSANRPTWRSTSLGAEWDGTNDNLTFTLESAYEPNGGAHTIIILAENRDSTNGSHVQSFSGGVYITVVGDSNSSEGSGHRFAHHYGTGAHNLGMGPDSTYLKDNQMCVLESRRDSLSAAGRMGFNNSTAGSVSLATGDTYSANSIGAAGAPGSSWQMDGYQLCNIKWAAYMTAAQVDMYIKPWVHYRFPGVSTA